MRSPKQAESLEIDDAGGRFSIDAASGVVDQDSRLFGYRNFLVCDGSTVPANPGVNPSLTITAMSEHAMSQVPPKGTATPG